MNCACLLWSAASNSVIAALLYVTSGYLLYGQKLIKCKGGDEEVAVWVKVVWSLVGDGTYWCGGYLLWWWESKYVGSNGRGDTGSGGEGIDGSGDDHGESGDGMARIQVTFFCLNTENELAGLKWLRSLAIWEPESTSRKATAVDPAGSGCLLLLTPSKISTSSSSVIIG
ncbi:hypothetical protein Tco_0088569 [Tanacetum coccineum]